LLFNVKWASNFVSYIMAETYYILMKWWDVHSVLNLYTTSSLKQQSMGRNVLPLGHNILIPSQPVIALTPKCCMFSQEAVNTNIIVFGLTWPGLEHTIYHTQSEHTNHYITETLRIFRNYRHLFERQFWTNHTIFIRPKKLDFES
jgi:hypothetical protein